MLELILKYVFYCYIVDTTHAGRGIVTALVKGHTSQPGVTVSGTVQGLSALSFVPVEAGEHFVFVLFNNVNISGTFKYIYEYLFSYITAIACHAHQSEI